MKNLNKVFKYFIIVWISGTAGWIVSAQVYERKLKEVEYLTCFYDAIIRNRPHWYDNGAETCLAIYNLTYLQGACAGKTGVELMHDKAKYGPFSNDVPVECMEAIEKQVPKEPYPK